MTPAVPQRRETPEIPPVLLDIPGVDARPGALLAPLTTFRIGGPADLVLLPRTREGLEAAIREVRQSGIELLVIGAGSNLLIGQEGFRGVAVKVGSGLTSIRVAGSRMVADAGRTLPELMRRARREGLSGLEFAGGIPGSLGGSLMMNAGAWQHEMSEVADWVIGVNRSGETRRVEAGEITWSYRRGHLPEPMTIVEAGLQLTPDDPEAIADREDRWHEERRRTQPLGEPSAGCVFKNPAGAHASQLIDTAGLKGERIGGAMVSPVHANFIINIGDATADDVMALIDRVRAGVSRVHGVELELEVELVNSGGDQGGG